MRKRQEAFLRSLQGRRPFMAKEPASDTPADDHSAGTQSEEEAKSDTVGSPSSQEQGLLKEPSEHEEKGCQHAEDTESNSATTTASPPQESELQVAAATPSEEAKIEPSASSPSQESGPEEPSSQSIESSDTPRIAISSLLQEPDLSVATANFLATLKNLKFLTLPNPCITPYGKQQIRALTSASWPAQELLLESVQGTLDAPGPLASFDGIRLLDEDEECLTDAVNAAAYCLTAIMVQMGLVEGEGEEETTTAETKGDGNCRPAIDSGKYNNDLLVAWTTAQTLHHRFESAHEAVHELTETLGEVLTKYGVKCTEPASDASWPMTPALPAASKNEETHPEPDGLIAQIIERIQAFVGALLLPPEPQKEEEGEKEEEEEEEEEDEPLTLGHADDDADGSREFLRDELEYQYLTHRYPPTKNFSSREPKHLSYHKEVERRFMDLQAKFDKRYQSHPHLHRGTGQLLFRRQVETRILLHRGWQSSLKSKGSGEVGEGKMTESHAKTKEKTQGAYKREPEVLKI